MYHYALLEPFALNWKYVAPKSFTELEVFLNPGLSIVIDRISSGKNDFAIGAYLTESKNKKLFADEFLVRRSIERINRTFAIDEVSAFFTPAEADELKALFEEERFIAKDIKVYKEGEEVDIFKLDEDDFSDVMTMFVDMGVRQTLEFGEQGEMFETLRTDMYEQAYEKAKKAYAAKSPKGKTTRKTLYKKVAVGIGGVFAGAVLKQVSKKLMTKGIWGIAAGALINVTSLIVGLIGVRAVDSNIDYYSEGVIFE